MRCQSQHIREAAAFAIAVLAAVFAFCMAAPLLQQQFSPSSESVAWAEDSTSIFQSGTGTQDDPYTVSTLAQLEAFRDSVNTGTTYEGQFVSLVSDLDLNGVEWTPIGIGTRVSGTYDTSTSHPFAGTFDGDAHTISNLTITTTSGPDYAIGLFGILDGAAVANLNLEDVDIQVPASELAGAVAGLMVNDSTIESVNVTGSVKALCGVGGICGRMIISGTISDCTNTASVTSTGGTGNVGGICGAAYYTQPSKRMRIVSCTNTGAVSGPDAVGGICGLSAAFVDACLNKGPVTGSGYSVGGICGEARNYGAIDECLNMADVTNTSTDGYGTGGIVGWVRYSGTATAYAASAPISVTNNANTGSVKGGNDGGGIVGTLYGAGTVEGNTNNAPSISGTEFAAGIVGNLQEGSALPSSVVEGAIVDNNVSTTPEDMIKAVYTNPFAYNNDDAIFTVKDNGRYWEFDTNGSRHAVMERSQTDAGSSSSDSASSESSSADRTVLNPSPMTNPSPAAVVSGIAQTSDNTPLPLVLGLLGIAIVAAGSAAFISRLSSRRQ